MQSLQHICFSCSKGGNMGIYIPNATVKWLSSRRDAAAYERLDGGMPWIVGIDHVQELVSRTATAFRYARCRISAPLSPVCLNFSNTCLKQEGQVLYIPPKITILSPDTTRNERKDQRSILISVRHHILTDYGIVWSTGGWNLTRSIFHRPRRWRGIENW